MECDFILKVRLGEIAFQISNFQYLISHYQIKLISKREVSKNNTTNFDKVHRSAYSAGIH